MLVHPPYCPPTYLYFLKVFFQISQTSLAYSTEWFFKVDRRPMANAGQNTKHISKCHKFECQCHKPQLVKRGTQINFDFFLLLLYGCFNIAQLALEDCTKC